MNNVLTVVKKELRRFFTDKRMLLTLILPGIVLYLVYSLMGSFVGDMMTGAEDKKYRVGINENTAVVQTALDGFGLDYQLIEGLSEENALAKLKEEEIDLYIYTQAEATVEGGETLPSIEIYYNSTSMDSSAVYSAFYPFISQSSAEIKPLIYLNAFKTTYDIATGEDTSIMILTMMFPLIMLVFLFSGSMAVSTESIAGEKERGTIATLLVTPVKRSHIAIGKVIALSVTSLASAVVSALAVMLSIPKLMSGVAGEGMEISLASYGVSEILGLLVVIVFTVMLFTVALSIVSTVAKSVKEATSYASPIMLLIVLIGLSSMFTGGEVSPLLCFIPIYNAVVCMSSIMSLSLNPLCIVFTAISNTLFIALGIFILAKLFSNEKVMFSK